MVAYTKWVGIPNHHSYRYCHGTDTARYTYFVRIPKIGRATNNRLGRILEFAGWLMIDWPEVILVT